MQNLVFSKQFISKWQEMLFELYGYSFENGFAVVKELNGKKNYVYLPLLNYTDLLKPNFINFSNYQIRLLNFNYNDSKLNDTVTMRLELEGDIFNKKITSKCRNQIRKAIKENVSVTVRKFELLDEFYECFKDTMNRYGTPIFDKFLFELILNHFNANIILARLDNKTLAGLIVIFDKDIAFVPWAGSYKEYQKLCPNHAIYLKAIELSQSIGKKIFDFGRSPYLGSTYSFKKQWGAKPAKIDIISDKNEDIYAKYSLASKIYKILPNSITDFLGPKICKYLPDL